MASSTLRDAPGVDRAIFLKTCRFDKSELKDWSESTLRLHLDDGPAAILVTHATKCEKCDTEYFHVDESTRNFYLKPDSQGNPEMHCTECESPLTVVAESLFARDLIREHFSHAVVYYPESTPQVLCPKCERVPATVEVVPVSEEEILLRAKCNEITLKGELGINGKRLSPEVTGDLRRLTRIIYRAGLKPRMEHSVPLELLTRETHIPTEVLRETHPPKKMQDN